jgi:glucose uptake protein
MIVIDSYFVAVLMCVVTMLCWGSWANTQKLASREWAFPLFYWDYSLGVMLFSLVLAFTMGSMGEHGRPFMTDLTQASHSAISSALIGGIIFNVANILLVAAIDIAGMSVAFPVGIGLALVLGVITNYIAVPVGNSVPLFSGVAAVSVAIGLAALSYKKISSGGALTTKGLGLSVVAGVLMGFFYRFVADSISPGYMNSTDLYNLEAGKLSPYTALVVFSGGLLLSNFLWNTIAMYKPFTGKPVTYNDYFSQGSSRLHLIGILGGAIWCLGMGFSIIAAGAAGPSISYGLGQGATLVAAIWGVFVWREFKGAPQNVNTLLALMFLFYVAGLALIIVSRN